MSLLSTWFAVSSLYKKITRGPLRVWREAVENHTARNNKPLTAKQSLKLGKKLYRFYLEKFIEDLSLEQDELDALVDIKEFFTVDDTSIIRLHRQFSENAVSRLARLRMEDRVLSHEERNEIGRFARLLNLEDAELQKIIVSNALKLYQAAITEVSSDRRVSPDEIAELEKLKRSLGLQESDLRITDDSKKQLHYFRLLWDVENGILPEVNAPVVLQKKEVSHFAVPAQLLVVKLMTTGYSAASSGWSIRVVKGLTYRFGQTRAHPIKQQVLLKYPGVLVVTSKRVVFSATQKGFVAPFRSLDNFEPFEDGIGLQKGSNYYLLQCTESELLAMILASSLKKYFDDEE